MQRGGVAPALRRRGRNIKFTHSLPRSCLTVATFSYMVFHISHVNILTNSLVNRDNFDNNHTAALLRSGLFTLCVHYHPPHTAVRCAQLSPSATLQ
jgi:hypothetical protein